MPPIAPCSGGGGVDGVIRRAAGRAIKAWKTLGGCDTGEAKITPGFSLPARYVIQIVGPVWGGGERGEDRRLAACYRNPLMLAREHPPHLDRYPGHLDRATASRPTAPRILRFRTRRRRQYNETIERVMFCRFSAEFSDYD